VAIGDRKGYPVLSRKEERGDWKMVQIKWTIAGKVFNFPRLYATYAM
jgi:hypothetical protein